MVSGGLQMVGLVVEFNREGLLQTGLLPLIPGVVGIEIILLTRQLLFLSSEVVLCKCLSWFSEDENIVFFSNFVITLN